MPEEVTLSSCKTYIRVNSSGQPDAAEVIDAIKKIISISEDTGISSVLVDARNSIGVPGTGESYDVAKFLSDSTDGKIDFAILVHEYESHHSFFKYAASDWSRYPVEYFTDESSAIDWLETRHTH